MVMSKKELRIVAPNGTKEGIKINVVDAINVIMDSGIWPAFRGELKGFELFSSGCGYYSKGKMIGIKKEETNPSYRKTMGKAV